MRTHQRNLGTRRTCSSCDTKYYDFNQAGADCPRCSAPAHSEDGDPRASAMARIKAEGPRKKSEDEELPFGLDKPKETEEAEEEENGGLNELGALTAETSAGGNNYDYD